MLYWIALSFHYSICFGLDFLTGDCCHFREARACHLLLLNRIDVISYPSIGQDLDKTQSYML